MFPLLGTKSSRVLHSERVLRGPNDHTEGRSHHPISSRWIDFVFCHDRIMRGEHRCDEDSNFCLTVTKGWRVTLWLAHGSARPACTMLPALTSSICFLDGITVSHHNLRILLLIGALTLRIGRFITSYIAISVLSSRSA